MDLVTATMLCAMQGSPLLAPCPAALQHPAQSAPSPVRNPVDLSPWQGAIAAASQRFSIPRAWIGAVIAAESGGRTMWQGAPIVSSAGAMGLMQVMPGTYRAMRNRYALGADPFDPTDNILAGTAYLRALYDRYGYPDLFAAYQAGPKRLEAWLDSRKPLPVSTQAYLDQLIPGIAMAFETCHRSRVSRADRLCIATRNPARQRRLGVLFFLRADAAPSPKSERDASGPGRDFGRHSTASEDVSPPSVFVSLCHPRH